jgi:hypothetical protein
MNTSAELVIYTEEAGGTLAPFDQRPNALALLESATVLESAGGRMAAIVDETQAAKAAEYRAQANQLIKQLDAERLETTEGARKTVERINAKFNGPIDKLRGFVRTVDKALQAYMHAKAAKQRAEREALERVQREEQAAREAEARALNVEPPPPPPPLVIPPSDNPLKITGSYGASLSVRDNWKWRVKDIAQVPDALLVPPEERILKAAMNSLAKSKAKAALDAWRVEHPGQEPPASFADLIPGIEIYNDPVNASRVL